MKTRLATPARTSLLFFLQVMLLFAAVFVSRSYAIDTVINTYTKATLPFPGTTGRLVNLSDGVRGLFLDTGTQWLGINGEIFNVVQFGATGDGTTDDWSAINQAVAAADAAGGGTVYFPSGIYLVGAAIPMKSNVHYVGNGWSTCIRAKSGTLDNVMGEAYPPGSVNGIVIRDLQIDGNNANVSWQSDDAYQNGIRWDRVSCSRITNVFIHGTVFNAVSIYNTSSDNIVEKCLLTEIGKTGASGTQNGVFLEFGVNRNKVQYNRILATLNHGVLLGESVGGATSYDNAIVGNVIGYTEIDGIRVAFESGTASIIRTKVVNNHILGGGANAVGIRLFMGSSGYLDDALMEGNVVSNCANGILLQGANIRRAIVTNNQTTSNSGKGLGIEGTGGIVSNNVSLSNGINYSNIGTGFVEAGNVVDDSGNFAVAGKLTIGGGTPIAKYLGATASWDPPSIARNVGTSKTVTVNGAAIGDPVMVGFSVAVPAKANLYGAVTAANTVTVTLMNNTGASLDLSAATLRVGVWQH